MAFKRPPKSTNVSASPDELLRELPRRKIPDVLPHQREMMRSCAATALNAPDVAMQLPTGSGKTLATFRLKIPKDDPSRAGAPQENPPRLTTAALNVRTGWEEDSETCFGGGVTEGS